MNTRAIALTLCLGAAVAGTCVPALATEPSTLAPSPVTASKFVVHVDGMT